MLEKIIFLHCSGDNVSSIVQNCYPLDVCRLRLLPLTTYHLPGTRAAFLQEPFLADTWQSHPTGGTMLIFPNGWNLLVPIPPWVAPSCLYKENPLLFWCRTANFYYPDVQCLFILEIYIFVVMKLYYIFCKSHMGSSAQDGENEQYLS